MKMTLIPHEGTDCIKFGMTSEEIIQSTGCRPEQDWTASLSDEEKQNIYCGGFTTVFSEEDAATYGVTLVDLEKEIQLDAPEEDTDRTSQHFDGFTIGYKEEKCETISLYCDDCDVYFQGENLSKMQPKKLREWFQAQDPDLLVEYVDGPFSRFYSLLFDIGVETTEDSKPVITVAKDGYFRMFCDQFGPHYADDDLRIVLELLPRMGTEQIRFGMRPEEVQAVMEIQPLVLTETDDANLAMMKSMGIEAEENDVYSESYREYLSVDYDKKTRQCNALYLYGKKCDLLLRGSNLSTLNGNELLSFFQKLDPDVFVHYRESDNAIAFVSFLLDMDILWDKEDGLSIFVKQEGIFREEYKEEVRAARSKKKK